MDFRTLVPARLTWLPGKKVAYGTGTFRFQTPPMASTSVLSPRFGKDARDILLSCHSRTFRSFLAAVEAAATATDIPETRGLMFRECLGLGGEWALTAFESDCCWFDADGIAMEHIPFESSGTCSCLVELTGYWTSAASWGLKFRVLEIKACAGRKAPACHTHGFAFREDIAESTRVAAPVATSYAFRDE